jgi:hypothetical protein
MLLCSKNAKRIQNLPKAIALAELKNIPIVPRSVAKSPQFQRESISQRNVTLLSTYLRITFCACCWEAMVGDRVV